MQLRVISTAIFCLACFATAAATLWYCFGRQGRAYETAEAMPVPWAKSRSTNKPGPNETWSISDLRSLAADAHQTPEQRVQAICLLANSNDWESVETLIAQLDDPLPLVRGRAAVAIWHILGTDFYYRAEDDRPKRLASIDGIRRYWESRKENPPVMEERDE